DIDKVEACGLTPVLDDKAPYFAEAEIVLFCKKAAKSRFEPAEFIDETIDGKWYPDKDYHFIYYGEIEKVLISK
ncbi:MAG: flavin reductase family protein, partial [Eubacterium sp.]|nr:flavin reductase family protein [Eubacterium sp.]